MQFQFHLRHRLSPVLCVVLLLSTSCSRVEETSSQPLVTAVDHTVAKRQSIGNCWIYAQSTWLESLLLTETGEQFDVSESYWTWWNWYDLVVGSSIQEIDTGGWWSESAGIVADHGWVLEKEFIPEEEDKEMSSAQAAALAYMNMQLSEGGALATRADRSPENVRAELDKAFGTDMAATEVLARSADETVVGTLESGEKVTLSEALHGTDATSWQTVVFPRVYGKDTRPTVNVKTRRKNLLQRVLRALNDNQPVVMSLMIDFNALDREDQTFKVSTLSRAGGPGSQGGHMVVLNDYTVKNVPGHGYIGEGVVSEEMQEAALLGQIVLFKAKNSWGKNRADRGLTDGFTRFDYDYLTRQLEWKDDHDGESSSYYTTLSSFVLPPGY
jgi:hypothetical protein